MVPVINNLTKKFKKFQNAMKHFLLFLQDQLKIINSTIIKFNLSYQFKPINLKSFPVFLSKIILLICLHVMNSYLLTLSFFLMILFKILAAY